MGIRLTGGSARGQVLREAVGAGVRPTSSRVREALFSILGDRVQYARVLDLFAGSGALGIEALSRGAASATFVDKAAPAIRAVTANLEALGAEGTVVRAEARRFLGGASRSGRSYDLVFLDPPYRLARVYAHTLEDTFGAHGEDMWSVDDRRGTRAVVVTKHVFVIGGVIADP